jgi:hypothetical protein
MTKLMKSITLLFHQQVKRESKACLLPNVAPVSYDCVEPVFSMVLGQGQYISN